MTDSSAKLARTWNDFTFELQFARQQDRFAHQLIIRSHDKPKARVLLSSLEGDSQQDWPASPPLQEIHLQEIDGRNVVMGVGMAGSAHWSIACESQTNDSSPKFVFDLACRVSEQPVWLGSSYQFPGETASIASVDDYLSVEVGSGFILCVVALSIENEQAPRLAVSDSGELTIAASARGQEHEEHSPSSPARTIRWQYQLEIRKSKQ